MTTWHLRDARGSEVGPLSRDVAIELLRQRPGVFTAASTDRVTWLPVRGVQMQAEVAAERPEARAAREQQETERTLFDLDRFQDLEPHALFGVPRTATAREFRQGFLNLAKRYHPGRLPRDASAPLVKAYIAVYQHLTEVIQQQEARLASAPPPRPSAPPPRPSAPRPLLPTWELSVLKLKQEKHQVAAHFSVTRKTAFVFTAHRLMNLGTSSVFFPCLPALPLGTKLGLAFEFEEARRVVPARGAVAFESATAEGTLRGFGVHLELKPEERRFMQQETERLLAPG